MIEEIQMKIEIDIDDTIADTFDYINQIVIRLAN